MRTAVIAFGLLLGTGSAAFAADADMAPYFGNTLIVTSQMGELKVHYKADHTFDSKADGPAGKYQSTGTWAFDAQGNLCATYEVNGHDLPPGTPNPFCSPFEKHAVGDTWTAVGKSGRAVNLTLVAGRH